MSATNGLIEQLREHTKHADTQLKSIEHVTEKGLKEVATSVQALSNEIRNLRDSLLSALLEQQRETHKASYRIVVLTLGTITSILVAVFVWITGVEPHLPRHSPLLKHDISIDSNR